MQSTVYAVCNQIKILKGFKAFFLAVILCAIQKDPLTTNYLINLMIHAQKQ